MAKTMEKNTQLVIGILGLIVLLIYVINAFKLGDFSTQIYSITGIALATILFIEGGVMTYFKQERYKTIDWKDFVVWLTMGVAFIVLVNTIFGVQVISKAFPTPVVTFFGNIAGTVGILAGIMVLIHIITPRAE